MQPIEFYKKSFCLLQPFTIIAAYPDQNDFKQGQIVERVFKNLLRCEKDFEIENSASFRGFNMLI